MHTCTHALARLDSYQTTMASIQCISQYNVIVYCTVQYCPSKPLPITKGLRRTTYCISEFGKEWYHSVVGDHTQVLLIFGYLGNSGTHTRQNLTINGLEQTHNELQTTHKRSHQFTSIFGILNTRADGPGSTCLHLWGMEAAMNKELQYILCYKAVCQTFSLANIAHCIHTHT